jgi:hypothetical protein
MGKYMKNKYTLKVFHPEGHYRTTRGYSHLTSDYDIDTGYDSFEAECSPIAEVVYWNRIYKMQNGQDPVMPQRIEKWESGQFTVVKFNPYFFKVANWILKLLPTSIRRYRRNWNYVRFFGM